MLHKALLASPKEFRISIASRNRPADRKICGAFLRGVAKCACICDAIRY